MDLNQTIFYMIDNKIHSALITSKAIVENEHDSWDNTPEQRVSWQPFGKSGVYYTTCHGTFNSDKVFGSKEELTQSL